MKDEMTFNGRVHDATKVITARYGITAPTLWRWRNRNLVPAPIRLGHKCFYDRELVETLISKGE